VPASLERSRSGKRHIWLFFEEAIPAMVARNLGKRLDEVLDGILRGSRTVLTGSNQSSNDRFPHGR